MADNNTVEWWSEAVQAREDARSAYETRISEHESEIRRWGYDHRLLTVGVPLDLLELEGWLYGELKAVHKSRKVLNESCVFEAIPAGVDLSLVVPSWLHHVLEVSSYPEMPAGAAGILGEVESALNAHISGNSPTPAEWYALHQRVGQLAGIAGSIDKLDPALNRQDRLRPDTWRLKMAWWAAGFVESLNDGLEWLSVEETVDPDEGYMNPPPAATVQVAIAFRAAQREQAVGEKVDGRYYRLKTSESQALVYMAETLIRLLRDAASTKTQQG